MPGHDSTSGWTGGNIYEASLAALESGIRATAPTKNVAIVEEALHYVAERAADAMELADHYQVLREDVGASQRAADAIHRAIDEYFFLQVGAYIARFFGVPEAGTSFGPIFVQRTMRVLHGERGLATTYQWPDPKQYAAELLASQPHASLFWRPPEGGIASLSMRFWSASGDSPPSPASLASELHRPSREGPAERRTDADGATSLEAYVEHGKLHRDPAEGPAFFQRVEQNGQVRLLRKYVLDGVLHRPSGEGPAVIETDESGHVLLEIYMEHGKRHRDPAAGPAFYEIEDIDGEVGPFFEYWQNGELHRPSADGPAVRKTDMTGCLLLEVYFEHGKRHRDPADGPAFFRRKTDGQEVRLIYRYFWEDALHRDARQGPAAIETDAGGRVLLEIYMEHGKHHRDPADGPALIERDSDTGTMRRYEYYQHGLLHRPAQDAPAVLEFSLGYGPHPTHEAYYRDGGLHHEDGPAIIVRCPETGASIGEWHYARNRLHRDDGPAIISRHSDGTIYYEGWYRDDVLLQERGDPCAGLGDDPDAANPAPPGEIAPANVESSD